MLNRMPCLLVAACLLAVAPPFRAAPPAQEKPAGDGTIAGELTRDAPFDPARTYHHKVHEVKMAAGKVYLVDLESTFVPHLRLEDGLRRPVNTSFRRNNAHSTGLITAPRDDTFRFVVSTQQPNQTGTYRLSIRPLLEAFVAKDKLSENDALDVVRQQCRHKVINFRMLPSKTYVIEMHGKFDTYLRLEDSTGKQIAQDDDSAGNLQARLVFRPERDDTYRIIATSCGGNTTGDFILSVHE